MANPTEHHWQACKRVLRYLSYTQTCKFLITKSSIATLTAFLDVDWARSTDDKRSTSGYAVYRELILSLGLPRNRPLLLDPQ